MPHSVLPPQRAVAAIDEPLSDSDDDGDDQQPATPVAPDIRQALQQLSLNTETHGK